MQQDQECIVNLELSETEADVPLNDTDKAWIREAVESAHKRQGVGKFTGFLKDWLGAGAAIAVVIFVLTQWNAYTEFRTHTNDRLDAIETSLRSVQASTSPRKVLGDIAGLSPKSLAQNLPALRTISEQPVAAVRPNPVELRNVEHTLTQVDDQVPDYWPTLFQFLTFASSAVSPNVPPPGSPITARIENSAGLTVAPHGTYVLIGSVGDVRFVSSRIVFTSTGVTLKNVTFVNCVFDFPRDLQSPPENLRSTSRTLLASGLQDTIVAGI